MKRLSSSIGTITILLAAAFWGCIGIFARHMTACGFSTIQTVTVRAFFTTLIVGIIILIKNPRLFRIRLRDWWLFFGSGICSFLFFNVCYMTSIQLNSLSVSCILMYTSPFWVVFLSAPLFKEKLTLPRVLSLFVAFIGCAMVSFSPSLKLTGMGLVFGLLSGFGYALYSIFGKVAATRYNSMTITFYTFLFALIGALPFCDLPNLIPRVAVSENLLWSVMIAVINTVIPYLLYTYGLSKVDAGKASVIAIMEPVVAALVGTFCFNEFLGWIGWVGIALVFVGLALLERHKATT